MGKGSYEMRSFVSLMLKWCKKGNTWDRSRSRKEGVEKERGGCCFLGVRGVYFTTDEDQQLLLLYTLESQNRQ